jgi:hypothetical protein
MGGKRANRHPQPSTLVSRDNSLIPLQATEFLRLTHKQFKPRHHSAALHLEFLGPELNARAVTPAAIEVDTT